MDRHALECLDFAGVNALLARYALSPLGQNLAERIQPVAKLNLMQRWLAQVVELAKLRETRGLPPFADVFDIRALVERCAPPLRITVDDMSRIRGTLAATHALRRYLHELPPDAPEIATLAGRIGDFHTLAERITKVIDERGEVRTEASPKLGRIRADMQAAQERISRAVDDLLREPWVRRILQYPNPTSHNDRVVLPLKTEYRGRLPGIIHRTSDTGATIYVEPAVVVELNNRIADLKIAEQEEINRLLWDLAHEVHINAEPITQTIEALALLDLVAAKVRFADDFELRVPLLVDEPVLDVRGARHPLLMELFRSRAAAAGEPAQEVVPIDYRLGLDFKMMLLTGPNTGGKTVALKTIGLLVYMVQSGIPVPVAPLSRMGVFSNVLIDIGDEQSIEQNLSTFSAHLLRLMETLERAGPRTLVLIDELGAGTDPDEGAAIGAAILEELLRKDARTIATTHLGALKRFALTHPEVENASVDFDIETLRPTYHLRIGEPGRSNAIHIAHRLGMPKRLVMAAERNLSKQARALRDALDGTAAVKRAAEQAREEAKVAELAAHKAAAAAERERARLQQQQSDYATWVQRVVHLRPGDAVRVRGFDRDGKVVKMRIDLHRAEVSLDRFSIEVPLGDLLPPEAPPPPPRPVAAAPPKPPREAKPAREGNRPAAVQNGGDGRPAPRRPQHQPKPGLSDDECLSLAPGDAVYVKRFHRRGHVVRVLAAKKIVIVNVGLLEVEAPFSGLAPPNTTAPPKAG
ncbi:MAG: DNA strand exchange inhibitor protein [Phycisphaerae bacterium]|nr:DNA strand exchange inhibitor protein [Phycisphaerae bacterium]